MTTPGGVDNAFSWPAANSDLFRTVRRAEMDELVQNEDDVL